MTQASVSVRGWMLAWVACAIVGCGGGAGDSAMSPELSAAQQLATRAGRTAQATTIDPASIARTRALATASGAALTADAQALFDFGEANFKQYFPSHQPDKASGTVAYRYYPETGAYLVVDTSSQIYVFGGPFGPAVILVGKISDYLKAPCVTVSSGFDVTLLAVPPVINPGGGDGSGGGGGDGGGDGGGAGGASGEGAIRDADVRVFDATGREIGSAKSDERGLVRLKSCGAPGPFLIEYAGNAQAQYYDEAIALRDSSDSNAWRPFPETETLRAYVDNLEDHHVVVSVMTHVAALDLLNGGNGFSAGLRRTALSYAPERGRVLAAPAVTASAVRAANERSRTLFNQRFASTGIVIDDVTRAPSLAYSLDSLRAFGDNPAGRYGQALTALAKGAARFNPSLASPAREMTKQLARDLSDGVIDGKDRTGAPVALTTQTRAYEPADLGTTLVAAAKGRLTTEVSGTGTVQIVSSTAPAETCADGSAGCYPVGAVVTLQAVPGSGRIFKGWTGACEGTNPACVVTMLGDKAVSAGFGTATATGLAVTVTGTGSVTSVPSGIECPSRCTAELAPDSRVTLTAAPVAGGSFIGWGGACAAQRTATSCTVTLDAFKTVSATFATAGQPVLSVSVSGTGGGVIISKPTGLSCESSCAAAFPAGTSVTLTASPADGSTFGGWLGACPFTLGPCTVTLSASLSVRANFSRPVSPTLSVSIAGTGGGTVTSQPAGISCGDTCSATFAPGSMVTLTATPSDGSTFSGWSGACPFSLGTCTVTMDVAKSVTATFALRASSAAARAQGRPASTR